MKTDDDANNLCDEPKSKDGIRQADKTINAEQNTDAHTLTSTGRKLYQCKLCNKLFTENSLDAHMLVHKRDNVPKHVKDKPVNNRKEYQGKHLRVRSTNKPASTDEDVTIRNAEKFDEYEKNRKHALLKSRFSNVAKHLDGKIL